MIIIDYTAHIHNFIYTFFLRQVADPTLKAATILCVCVFVGNPKKTTGTTCLAMICQVAIC